MELCGADFGHKEVPSFACAKGRRTQEDEPVLCANTSATDLGWGPLQPGSGVAVDWVTCPSYSSAIKAERRLRALRRCLREADWPVGRAELPRSRSLPVVSPRGSLGRRSCAVREPEDHKRFIARLPGCAGQAADAVSAHTQVKMKDAPSFFQKFKVRMSRYLDTSTKRQMA